MLSLGDVGQHRTYTHALTIDLTSDKSDAPPDLPH